MARTQMLLGRTGEVPSFPLLPELAPQWEETLLLASAFQRNIAMMVICTTSSFHFHFSLQGVFFPAKPVLV